MRGTVASVGRDLGRILQALGVLTLLSLVVPLVAGEWYAAPGLAVSGLVPLATGSGLRYAYDDAPEPGKLHGMVTAAGGWFLVAVFGALPFLAVAWTVRWNPAGIAAGVGSPTLAAFQDPVNALFESMSGFTGTGLTMTDKENVLPATLQWWRSVSEWVGGVGVIVLTTAILARPGSGSLTLYESEARSEKIHPSIVSTVRTIWWIFLLFTFVSILALWLAGMPTWDAVNHGMTGLSTGGFSVTDDSIAAYDSLAIEATLLPIMLLGSIAFPVHYLVLQGEFSQVWRDIQSRWVLAVFAVGTAALTGILVAQGPYGSWQEALRYASFQWISASSCTGFQTAGTLGTHWTPAAVLPLVLAMSVGAAAGSTVGGIKTIRALTLGKGVAHRIRGLFYPSSAVRSLRMGPRVLSTAEVREEFEEAAIISFLWFVLLAVGVAVLLAVLPTGTPLENVLFEVASAQGNVGLSAGITGPDMPTPAKLVFLLNMWVGRLEIIPVLVLLRSLLGGGIDL